MSDWYILDNQTPVYEPNFLKAAHWFENNDRTVKFDEIGVFNVSTVFLGMDHGLLENHPLLFETMIFGPLDDDYQARSATWEGALMQHQNACDFVRSILIKIKSELIEIEE